MTPLAGSTRHLTDCFSELFAYVMTIRQNLMREQLPYAQVRGEVMRLLEKSKTAFPQEAWTAEDYDLARYAVCAWIDESIMGSMWNEKTSWRPEMLQRVFYGSTDAGEKFYQRLKGLEAHQQSVREVFTLCLALGFKGRYCAPDDSVTLEQIKERQLKWLFNAVSEIPTPRFLEKNTLFPEAYPKPLERKKVIPRRFSSLWIIALSAPVGLYILLFLSYYLALAHMATNVVNGMP